MERAAQPQGRAIRGGHLGYPFDIVRSIHSIHPRTFRECPAIANASPLINLYRAVRRIEFIDSQQLAREPMIWELRDIIEIHRNMKKHAFTRKRKEPQGIPGRRVQVHIDGDKGDR